MKLSSYEAMKLSSYEAIKLSSYEAIKLPVGFLKAPVRTTVRIGVTGSPVRATMVSTTVTMLQTNHDMKA
jgi:hypothetical protein